MPKKKNPKIILRIPDTSAAIFTSGDPYNYIEIDLKHVDGAYAFQHVCLMQDLLPGLRKSTNDQKNKAKLQKLTEILHDFQDYMWDKDNLNKL